MKKRKHSLFPFDKKLLISYFVCSLYFTHQRRVMQLHQFLVDAPLDLNCPPVSWLRSDSLPHLWGTDTDNLIPSIPMLELPRNVAHLTKWNTILHAYLNQYKHHSPLHKCYTKHSYDCALLPLIVVAYIRDTPADSMDESRHRANMSNVSYMNPLVYHAIYLPQIYSDTIIM